MLLDAQNLFSDNQSITSGATNSTNVVKFGKGDISYLPLVIQVVKAFKVATALSVKIQTSEDASFETPINLAESKLTLDELVEGARFPISYLPKGNKGYIRLVYTPEGENAETDGKITAGVVMSDELSYSE